MKFHLVVNVSIGRYRYKIIQKILPFKHLYYIVDDSTSMQVYSVYVYYYIILVS